MGKMQCIDCQNRIIGINVPKLLTSKPRQNTQCGRNFSSGAIITLCILMRQVFWRTSGTGINLSLSLFSDGILLLWESAAFAVLPSCSQKGTCRAWRAGISAPRRHSAIKMSSLIFRVNKCYCHQETDHMKRNVGNLEELPRQ